MKLYQITLPTYANSGAPYTAALAAFEDYLLDIFGGFTRLPLAVGKWKDADGAVYVDEVRAYQIASDRETTASLLIDKAFALFPDQLAIFAAEIGEAHIIERASRPVSIADMREKMREEISTSGDC